MKKLFVFISMILLLALTSCESKEENVETNNPPQVKEGQPRAAKVLEAMDASTYTYLRVDENGKEYWMAIPQTDVKVGETVYFMKGMEMKNFQSPTLDKTFESLLMVEKIVKEPHSAVDVQSPHSQVGNLEKADIKIDPVAGGKTIAEIYSEKNSLKGRTVKVKGKVVKYNPGIMDRNWIHIQDGSGTKSDYDILVTTEDEVNVGDIIIAEGTVETDKDFGSGYSYSILIENAAVKTEKK